MLLFRDWMSLDSDTYSGSQKLLTRRDQTSTSLSSWMRSQLIATPFVARREDDTRVPSVQMAVPSSMRVMP